MKQNTAHRTVFQTYRQTYWEAKGNDCSLPFHYPIRSLIIRSGKILKTHKISTQRAKFTGPTWGPPGSCRPHMSPISAPWTLLSGEFSSHPKLCDRPSGIAVEWQSDVNILALNYASPRLDTFWYVLWDIKTVPAFVSQTGGNNLPDSA